MQILDAKNVYFRDLNKSINAMLKENQEDLHIKNVTGQRYIANAISGNYKLFIDGIPGNDMAVYMDGPEVVVNGNTQDALANTMNNGRVIVHGHTGDTAGYAMRGGEVYIKGNAGYRAGIHMKEYPGKKPVIVIGGKAGDFLGEYMAGGMIILLGLNIEENEKIAGNFCGAGMHNGTIYVRGDMDPYSLGKEVKQVQAGFEDLECIKGYIKNYSTYFGVDYHMIMHHKFIKLYADDIRPYGNLYAY